MVLFNREIYPPVRSLFDLSRWLESAAQERQPMFPALTLVEQKDRFILEAMLPGVTKEDLSVTVQGKTVYLEGRRKEIESGGSRYHRQERGSGSFRRALTLPIEIDVNAVRATQENGILHLELPKDQKVMPRLIKVN
jgi:HSP20 family protein